MNTIHTLGTQNRTPQANRKADRYQFCRKFSAQIEKAKDAILDEFRNAFAAPERLLHLALNEAEALACQTGFPHLVFPTLAREKVQAVTTWHARQQLLRRNYRNNWEQHFAA
jgi:hypothetical protein